MYIKLFESRQSAHSYVVQHDTSMRGMDHGTLHITNEQKHTISVSEDELFHLIDKLYRSKFILENHDKHDSNVQDYGN